MRRFITDPERVPKVQSRPV